MTHACARKVRIKRYMEGTEPLVKVPLFGIHGEGKTMILDSSVWDAGQVAGWPRDWIIQFEPTSGRSYVATTSIRVSPDRRHVRLVRLITEAGPGDVVVFLNDDTLWQAPDR